MRKLFDFIKKHLDKLMIIIGSGLFIYNVFNFSYEGNVGTKIALLPLGSKSFEGVAYYYEDGTLLLITIGIMIVITGIIIRKND